MYDMRLAAYLPALHRGEGRQGHWADEGEAAQAGAEGGEGAVGEG